MEIETRKVGALIDPLDLQDWKRLGHGGFGVVYRATWRDRVIAVKVAKTTVRVENNASDSHTEPPSSTLSRSQDATSEADMSLETRREWQILQSVRHAFIVQYIDAFVINHSFCLALEYADGGSLRGYLETLDEKGEKLPASQIHSFSIAMVSGLLYLHQNQIWHRDLKTDNILLVNNVPKISDFGLSRLEVSSKESGSSSKSKTVLIGSFQWAAPEWYEESTEYAASDIYVLGNILWALLTNKAPFSGCTLGYVASNFSKGLRPPMPEDGPALIKSIIARCWKSNTKERPRLTTILAELEAVTEFTSELILENEACEEEDMTHDTNISLSQSRSITSVSAEKGVKKVTSDRNIKVPADSSDVHDLASSNQRRLERSFSVMTMQASPYARLHPKEDEAFYTLLEKYGVSHEIQECFTENNTSQDEFLHLTQDQLHHLFPTANILQINKLLKIQEHLRGGKLKRLGGSESLLSAVIHPEKSNLESEEKLYEGLQDLDKGEVIKGLEKVKEAAERQVGLAQLKMAQFHFDGIGMNKDMVQCRSWLIRLAQNPFSNLLNEIDITQTLDSLLIHGMIEQELGNIERALSLYLYTYCTDINRLACLLGIYTIYVSCGIEIPRPRQMCFEVDIINRINSSKDSVIQQTIDWLYRTPHEQTHSIRTTFLGVLLQISRQPFGNLEVGYKTLEPLSYTQKGGLASYFVAEYISRIILSKQSRNREAEAHMIANYQHAARFRIASAHSRLARLFLIESSSMKSIHSNTPDVTASNWEKGKTHLQHALAWIGSHVWTLYGDLHQAGISTAKDNQEAILCYKKGAIFGDPAAQLQLSQISGIDKKEQFRLLTLASKQGNVDSCAKLAPFYRNAEGGAPYDMSEYIRLLHQAIDPEPCKTLYSKRNPSLEGIHELGRCFWSGVGVNESKEQAIKLFTKSGEKGYTLSQLALGDAYNTGSGVRVNKEEAFKWFLLAAENGNRVAQTKVSECYEKGIGVNKSAVLSKKWRDMAAKGATVDNGTSSSKPRKLDPLFGIM